MNFLTYNSKTCAIQWRPFAGAMDESVLVGSPVEQLGQLSILFTELEEGEIPQECLSNIPISSKSHKNFLARSRKRAYKKAVWLHRQDDRISRLSRELAAEVAVTSELRTVISQERLRNSELEAELRSAEWNLYSTERKLYVKTKPFPKERVLHYLATALQPDGDTDVLCKTSSRT